MFDERKARRVTGFIECLRHTKGEFHGKPFKLLPWQEKIIRDVFGTVRDDDPTMRQYTTAYIEIPKKQGKSELGAAIALNMLANDDEWKAEAGQRKIHRKGGRCGGAGHGAGSGDEEPERRRFYL